MRTGAEALPVEPAIALKRLSMMPCAVSDGLSHLSDGPVKFMLYVEFTSNAAAGRIWNPAVAITASRLADAVVSRVSSGTAAVKSRFVNGAELAISCCFGTTVSVPGVKIAARGRSLITMSSLSYLSGCYQRRKLLTN